ncbi:MAG: 50S ribosomal protein L24 [Elusimicrobia bacterium]|nr:50S ribosomal protein L24 [Elusimicrobiota bacterium]
MLNIRKKDKVLVLCGKDRGKRGEVVRVYPGDNSVVVSKVNIIKKHSKPTQTDPGGVKEIETPVNISNVMLVCPKCDQPTRPKFDFLSDGKKVRVCRKCGEMIV